MGRIMIVDDSSLTCRMISALLSQAGHQVETAENGLDALEKLYQESERYQLLVIDMNMPQMDGVELLRRLRLDDAYRNVPVIILSSDHDPEDVQRALKAGGNLYLHKPTDTQKLLACVSTVLEAV